MRLRRTVQAALTACATLAASAGLVAAGTGTAQAATPLPTRVFAPYFEAWTGQSPAQLASQSGAKYLTMAFLQASTKGSCTPYWNGDTSMPVSSSTFGADIATIRANGGDVIPSFGGYTADNTGTELADSCTDVNQIAAAFENVITTYDISRIDLDIEDNSLTNTAGIDRRNKAIKIVEDWAAANGRNIQFSYTLPTTTSGLASSGLAVLKNAVTNNARIDVVNMMTFDYYDNAAHDMAADTQTSAQGLYNQLAKLYPSKTPAQLWGSIGITEMIGIDDFGAAETFTVANANTVYNWAVSKGINTLSFWALQRDNGGCVGKAGDDNCSGISQNTWDFSHIFAPFTSGSTVSNDFSVSASPNSATVTAGSSTSSTIATAVTAGSAQSVNLTVSGAPAGVTATVTPGSVTAGNSATLNISTTSSVVPGSYPITVTGAAASGSHTSTFTLNVTGTQPGNDFSVAVNPNSGTVAAGSSASAAIATAVTSGSAQSVNLTVSGAPAGVTATATPGSVTAGNSATLNIATTSAAAAGTYPLTVTATGASGSHTATYSLTVTGTGPTTGLVNGDFESGSLSPWTCQSGGAVVSTPVHSGTHALQAAATASQTGECSQTVTLKPNTSYTLSGWVQGNYAYVGVSGGATASAWTSSAGWTKLSVPFTTGANGTVTVYLHGWYGQGTVYGDDFSIA
ncbi:carbohydrate binding domain-containing protein [Kitasatospora brasiliensis]|uniref:carbohydrate binding domain-containing protein n=1 Tax=Kitasatospora brasiliensis TaxID=3058040 RepID=UPI002930BDB1|nr:carbohydrate binding domain-containing protein [Kitasatospora sp. K002]